MLLLDLVVTGLAYNFATFQCAVWRTHWWIVNWWNWNPGRESSSNIILKKATTRDLGTSVCNFQTTLSPQQEGSLTQENIQSTSTHCQDYQDFVRSGKQEHRRITNCQRARHWKVYKRRLAGIRESAVSGVPTAQPSTNPIVGTCRALFGDKVCILNGTKSPSGTRVTTKTVKAKYKKWFQSIPLCKHTSGNRT